MHLSARELPKKRRFELYCEKGRAVLNDSYGAYVEIIRGLGQKNVPPRTERVPVSVDMPLYKELEAFVRHLRGGPAPRTRCSEAVATVEAVEKLRRLAGIP